LFDLFYDFLVEEGEGKKNLLRLQQDIPLPKRDKRVEEGVNAFESSSHSLRRSDPAGPTPGSFKADLFRSSDKGTEELMPTNGSTSKA